MERSLKRLPTVLVVTCSPLRSSQDLIRDILETSTVNPCIESDDIQEFSWNLDTKYYTASLTLSASKNRTVPSQEFSEAVEAVIIYFDPKNRSSFTEVKLWLAVVEQVYSPSIQLMICDNCSDGDEIHKKEILELCIDKQLELIEIQPITLDPDEEEFGSVHGIKRIQDALKAHTWSSLKMKPNPLRPSCLSSSDSESDTMVKEYAISGQGSQKETVSDEINQEREVDIFAQMFSKLHQFRAEVSNLPREQRKNYAEQITKQFWNSLGNDSGEEISEDE